VRINGGLVEIVERAYDVALTTPGWLAGIREAAGRAFGEHIATQAYTFSVTAQGSFHLHDISSDSTWEELLRRAHSATDPEIIRRLYLRGPINSVRAAASDRKDDPGYQEVLRTEVREVTGVSGIDPSGAGCTVAFLRRDTGTLPRSTRLALERISAHLASARRLRSSLDTTRPAEDLMEKAEAVVTPDGAVVHAQGVAREAPAQSALRQAARRIDKARCREGQDPGEDPLALWRGLVEGRWSLVERFESDGRRVLVARRNEPPARALRALDERERKLIALLAVGHSLKLCAYELGQPESTTSKMARSAMRKLGLLSRDELVEIHGAIVRTSDPSSSPQVG
jgi:DNA-binding CsgD family transcriptional regulator